MNRCCRQALLLILGLLPAVFSSVWAGEFRSIRPIAVPAVGAGNAVVQIRPVPREIARRALERVLASWNTPAFREILGGAFYDRDRLADAVNEVVPRDASIRLLAVRDVQTYAQRIDSEGQRRYRVSMVSVVAETQVEYNDPQQGFRRLDGVNEYLLELREPL